MSPRRFGWVVCAWLVAVSICPGCGPWFPENPLADDPRYALRTPYAHFAVELAPLRHSANGVNRLYSGSTQRFVLNTQTYQWVPQVAFDESANLMQTWKPSGVSEDERLCIIATYVRVMEHLRRQRPLQLSNMPPEAGGPGDRPPLSLVAALPAEFQLYFEGACWYYLGQADSAAGAWSKLLHLPKEERRHRGPWAAYMLGRLNDRSDPSQAITWYQACRRAVDEEAEDPLGLACASLGWEARLQVQAGRFIEGIHLYLRQWQSGDEGALISLFWTAHAALRTRGAADLSQLATDPAARQVLTAFVLHQSTDESGTYSAETTRWQQIRHQDWIRALTQAGAPTGRLALQTAWLAYQTGDVESAEHWLGLTGQGQWQAHWLRGKCAIYRGQTAQAAVSFSQALRLLPARVPAPSQSEDLGTLWILGEFATSPSEASLLQQRQFLADRALLELAQADYAMALDALLEARLWPDAAYVAESLLTLEELRRFVSQRPALRQDRSGPEEAATNWNPYDGRQANPHERLRWLLARRLARAYRFDEALMYLPAELRPNFRDFVQAYRLGHNTRLPRVERAAHLWQAAQLWRQWGMEWFGSENAPDGTLTLGDFEAEDFLEMRRSTEATAQADTARRMPALLADEVRRALAHRVHPFKRFHYRYRAADLAWQAARLMPDQSEETAKVLYTAGSWLKARDPSAADRFYQALVGRCSKTQLGRQAEALRWFPP